MNSRQMKDLVRNISKQTEISNHVLQRMYIMDKFLEKISYSKYRFDIVLKGGMLVASLVGIKSRSTLDIDISTKFQVKKIEELISIVNEIIDSKPNENISIKIVSTKRIMEDKNVNGYRINLVGNINNTLINFKVDITSGDYYYINENTYKYPLLLEKSTIELKTYYVEYILAEKIQTIINRGILNTRMRDFYDIHILYKTFVNTINYKRLEEALKLVFLNRDTPYEITKIREIIIEIMKNNELQNFWGIFQKKFPYSKEISWTTIMNSISKLLIYFANS